MISASFDFDDDPPINEIGIGLEVVANNSSANSFLDKLYGIKLDIRSTNNQALNYNMYGVYSQITDQDGSGNTDIYNFYAADPTSLSGGEAYGLYIENFTSAATTNYGIYQAGGDDLNILTGDTRIGGASPVDPTVALDVTGAIKGDSDVDFTLTGTENVTIGSTGATTAGAGSGVIDIDITTATANNRGIGLNYTVDGGASGSNYAMYTEFDFTDNVGFRNNYGNYIDFADATAVNNYSVGQMISTQVTGVRTGASGSATTGLYINVDDTNVNNAAVDEYVYGINAAVTGTAISASTMDVYGGRFAVTGNSGATTPTNYGLHVSATGADTNYTLYLADVAAGTNQYGIYQAGADDLNLLAGDTQIGDATTDPIIIAPVTAGGASKTGTITSEDLTDDRIWTFPDVGGDISVDSTDKTVATVIVAANDSYNKDKADFVGDGIGDDEQIEDAIAVAAAQTNGGVVYLLDGTYSIGTPADCSTEDGIDITDDNISLIGAGRGTVLQRACDTATDKGVITVGNNSLAVSAVTIADLSIDGVKATYADTENIGIHFNRKVTRSIIQNTYVHDNGGENIFLDGATGSENTDNLIKGNDLRNSNYRGIYLLDSNNNVVVGNNIQSAVIGIRIYSSVNNTITSNRLASNSVQGILLSTSSTHNTISGNNLESNGDGIYITSTSTDNDISGNTIRTSATDGIYISSSSRNNITGNVIDGVGASSDGISLNGADNNIISSNSIYDASGTTSYGVNVSNATSNDNYLIGNEISGGGFTAKINDAGTDTTIQHRDQSQIQLGSNDISQMLSLGVHSSDVTLTGALTGMDIDFDNYLTVSGQDVTGINISDITGDGGTETAINIGSGWDKG